MKMLKKIFFVIAAFSLLFFAGCRKSSNTLKVGATPEPHAEMLKLVKEDLENQGIKLEIIEFTDYVTPNEALESSDIDANFFQHIPYLESFNSEKGYHLANAGGIHIEPVALYSKKYATLDEFKSKAKVIAIPNDPTNEGRALMLLASEGIISLKEDVTISATPLDITENPLNLKFREIEAASLPRVLEDVDGAVINGNYAIPAGLIATKDGLIVEGASSPYVNVICVKNGNQDNEKIKALVKALQGENIKEWIEQKYPNGEVLLVD
ncbi:MAG: MetQ/NlpA family ABC transporter substrate-binding protein [Treponemataceae bacterium]